MNDEFVDEEDENTLEEESESSDRPRHLPRLYKYLILAIIIFIIIGLVAHLILVYLAASSSELIVGFIMYLRSSSDSKATMTVSNSLPLAL